MKSTFKTTRVKTKILAALLAFLLLLTLLPTPLTHAAYSDDINEYNIVSEHFTFHESLHPTMLRWVSPGKFNWFVDRMNEMYKAMHELTGSVPSGGARIIIRSNSLCSLSVGSAQHAHIGSNIICWFESSMVEILGTIGRSTESDWSFHLTPHELGHLFHDTHGWVFNREGWADMLSLYVRHEIGGRGLGMRPMELAAISDWSDNHRDLLRFVHPLFVNNPYDFSDWDDDSFERGWSVLQQVFRSYPSKIAYDETNDEKLVIPFVEKIAGVLGISVNAYLSDYCTEDARARWTELTGNPFAHNHAGCCIDYASATDVIVSSSGTPKINLTTETIDLAGFAAAEFSLDGGTKWKAVKADTFGDKKFAKLLNKGMTLHLKDAGGSTVTFPVINPRPKPKLAINYAIAADLTGSTPGQWVLAEKKDASAATADMQIGVAGPNDRGVENKGKTVDTNGWGKFQADRGICVRALPGGDKPKVLKTTYFYRAAPRKISDTEYAAAGKPKKITAKGQQKPTKYRLGTNKAKADNTYVNGTAYAKKTGFTLASGDQVWHGATAKKASTARQTVVQTTFFS
ncbi:MAG: hypothetical protein FWH04_01810 [Oscillospiraceae bacterium]|nr:hypothetical protein [Oscillospiraceae bacterium]